MGIVSFSELRVKISEKMDSKLNPASPEFFSNLKNVTLDGYLIIKQTVKSSKQYIAGGKFDPLKTNPAFKTLISDLSGFVTTQIKEIIAAELPKVVFTEQVEEPSFEDQLALLNNNILERVNSNLELLSNMAVMRSARNEQNIPPIGSMNEQVVCMPIRPIEPPAIALPPGVQCIDNIWCPIIRDKPNKMQELEFKLTYNNYGRATGYENPYKHEIDMFDPRPWMKHAREPITYPAPLKNTNFRYINTLPKFEKLLRHLREVHEFAVDVEHHSHRSYIGLTCLIQITTYMGDYIIDAIMLWPYMYKLNYTFTDPKKLKILHGAAMDVLWLQRDFGVYFVGMFDTFHAAKVLEYKNKSLKALLLQYCNINVNKKYQCADWRVRPLSYAMLRYARTDTHYLLYIWKRMKNDILEKYNGEKTGLRQVFADSKDTCMGTYKRRVVTNRSHLTLYHRSNKDYQYKQYNFIVLKKLYKWRDEFSKELDEGPSYLMSSELMLELAQQLPTTMSDLSHICASAKKPLLRNLDKLQEVINDCLINIPPRLLPPDFWCSRVRPQHMLDLPNNEESAEIEEVVPAEVVPAEVVSVEDPVEIVLHEVVPAEEQVQTPPESYACKAKTSNSTGRSEYRFCSPYLRYMKCMKVEKHLKKAQETVVSSASSADGAGPSNAGNVLEEFTPLYRDRETREREAEEEAEENFETEDDAGEGTSDGFTVVTRRKRNVRGKRVENTPRGRLGDRTGPSSQQAYNQYSKQNYTSFYTPKDKSNTKSSKKRK